MWTKIEQLPVEQLIATREMFVVKGFNVEGCSIMPYTTDVYGVWLDQEGSFVRWPHKFQPTHFILLPNQPEEK